MSGIRFPARPTNEAHRTGLACVQRRLFLRSGVSLGAIALLSGCDLQDGDTADRVLWAMSRWNDRVQGWLFRPGHLARTYPASAITRPFRFNAFYPEDSAPEIDGDTYALEVSGLAVDK